MRAGRPIRFIARTLGQLSDVSNVLDAAAAFGPETVVISFIRASLVQFVCVTAYGFFCSASICWIACVI